MAERMERILQGRGSEVVLEFPSTTLQRLMGGIPEQKFGEGRVNVKAVGHFYYGFAKSQVMPFVTVGKDSTRVDLVFRPIDGGGLNALLYIVAPDKLFGFDTGDILIDWDSLPRPALGVDELRLSRHRSILNWGFFERNMERYYEAIRVWSNSSFGVNMPAVVKPFLLPVASLNIGRDGRASWNLDEHVWQSFPRGYILSSGGPEPRPDPVVGLLAAAAYCSDVRERWPLRESYGDGCDRKQRMGATQAFALALKNADSLLASRFVSRVKEAYLKPSA